MMRRKPCSPRSIVCEQSFRRSVMSSPSSRMRSKRGGHCRPRTRSYATSSCAPDGTFTRFGSAPSRMRFLMRTLTGTMAMACCRCAHLWVRCSTCGKSCRRRASSQISCASQCACSAIHVSFHAGRRTRSVPCSITTATALPVTSKAPAHAHATMPCIRQGTCMTQDGASCSTPRLRVRRCTAHARAASSPLTRSNSLMSRTLRRLCAALTSSKPRMQLVRVSSLGSLTSCKALTPSSGMW
mmetsp:Transcript_11619/g.30263  ORF Transcript_11619/g.30263 Transcript_11619/m.30263 type:complete len:241 (+) Transcript_11619:299-1021(+)